MELTDHKFNARTNTCTCGKQMDLSSPVSVYTQHLTHVLELLANELQEVKSILEPKQGR